MLQSLIRLPDELMKLSSDKHLTLNSSFLLAMALATRVSEFHSSMGSSTLLDLLYALLHVVLYSRPKIQLYRPHTLRVHYPFSQGLCCW